MNEIGLGGPTNQIFILLRFSRKLGRNENEISIADSADSALIHWVLTCGITVDLTCDDMTCNMTCDNT